MTGVNSIMYYSTPILTKLYETNPDNPSPEEFASADKKAKIGTVLIDVAQIVFTVISLFVVDKVGRKVLIILGCVGCGATQLLFGIFYAYSP